MEKFAKFFLLAWVGLNFLGLSYAQDWSITTYNTDISIAPQCLCSLPPISLLAIYCLISILILSVLIMLSGKIFKKAGLKPRKSLVPIGNIYTLFGLAKSKIWQLLYTLIIILLLGIYIYGEYIYPTSSYSHCCYGEWIIWVILGIFAFFICILMIQFYKLARNFGLRKFSSILIAVFFPIGIWILSFGNYEYVGNKENEKNLESK